jgi:hypothetical protein
MGGLIGSGNGADIGVRKRFTATNGFDETFHNGREGREYREI